MSAVSDCSAKGLINSCETVPISMSICFFSAALLHSLDIYCQPNVLARPRDKHNSQSIADCRHLLCLEAAFSSVCIKKLLWLDSRTDSLKLGYGNCSPRQWCIAWERKQVHWFTNHAPPLLCQIAWVSNYTLKRGWSVRKNNLTDD